ncbi:MAG: CAAX prenyl protease-related protein [Pirellulales bacterium]|nr:CAAX prenyl protease-related protein [Pirellulales bacterium]
MNRKNPWLVFLLPFVVFMLVGAFEPTPDKPSGGIIGLSIPYDQYPLVYSLKIALSLAAVIFVWPGYREFPFRISPLSVAVGVVGIALWIGLCKLDLEHRYLQPFLDKLGLGWLIGSGERAGFNPLERLANQPVWAWTFLVFRFFGLALVVPIIEEFFLRGFVMRFVMEKDWWKVPFGRVNRLAVVAGTAVPMLMHPGELLAAAVWFSLVTWLMLRMKNIWDCVAAHAVTNFLLGVYVVTMGGEAWRLM